MATLYGIKNCDTVKKALKWLDQNGVDHQYHDFRVDGLEQAQVQQWIDELGWDTLVNKRSTSWKQLSEAQRASMDAASALEAIMDQPTLIKRPLLDLGDRRVVGFKADDYQSYFS